jgi:hypothetical protein
MTTPLPPGLQAIIRQRLGLPAPRSDRPPQGVREPSEGGEATSRPLTDKSQRASALPWPSPPPPLPAVDITRALRRFRYDPEFRGVRRVPIRAFAGLVGLSYETLYQAMRHRMSYRTRVKLTWAIKAILEGQLGFRRRGQDWTIEHR